MGDPKWGVVLKPSVVVPVYHRLGAVGNTACGRRIGFFASWLQIRHLKRFSKACKGCFPR